MRSRRSPFLFLLIVLCVAGLASGVASAQVCPQPPIGSTSLQSSYPAESGSPSAASWSFLELAVWNFSAAVNRSWGTGTMARPGTRSSAFVLRERRGLFR